MSCNACIFKDVLGTCSIGKAYAVNELTPARKATVISSSIQRKDDLCRNLENMHTLRYHDLCYTAYTSREKIKRHLKKINAPSIGGPSAKRLCRSSTISFNFKENCLICGDYCEVNRDPKHPDRWEKNRGILCRTADRGKRNKTFKEVLLEVSSISYFIFVTSSNSVLLII